MKKKKISLTYMNSPDDG